MRKQIFETIRAQRGKGFTADEVKAIDALLDRLGLEKDEKEEEPAAPPVAAPVAMAATNGAMREGDHPNNIAPLFNPKPHAGTDA